MAIVINGSGSITGLAVGGLPDGTVDNDTITGGKSIADVPAWVQEQADMAYWDRQNNTTTLDDAISAVKLQFPKPE